MGRIDVGAVFLALLIGLSHACACQAATNGVDRVSLLRLAAPTNSAVTAALLYKRVCTIHQCEYDIRYGSCPMCKAPDFGSGKPQFCPKCGCYMNKSKTCPRCGW